MKISNSKQKSQDNLYLLAPWLNKITQGDSLQLLETIPNSTIDFIFVDPPYNMGVSGTLLRADGNVFQGTNDEWDKFESFATYDEFSLKYLQECQRILKKDGVIAVIGSFQNIYRLGYHLQNLGFWIINDIVWQKSNPTPNFSGTRFVNAHETILLCTKSSKSKFSFNYHTMKHLNGNKQATSVWTLPICSGKERLRDEKGAKIHNTQKPLKLLLDLILSVTKPTDVVLDPFFGTGTTGVAAKILGRNYIGFEKDEKYVQVSQKRVDETIQDKNPIYQLSLEVKPPKVEIKTLIKDGFLKVGQKLYSKDKGYEVELMESGWVFNEQKSLSIHKMSALILNKVNFNGWSYFYYEDEKGELKPIDELRYKWVKTPNNEKNNKGESYDSK